MDHTFGYCHNQLYWAHLYKYKGKPRASYLGGTVMPANSKNIYSDHLQLEEVILPAYKTLEEFYGYSFAKQNTGNKRFGSWMPGVALRLTWEAEDFYSMNYPIMCKNPPQNSSVYKIAH